MAPDNDHIYTESCFELFRSTDGGVTYEEIFKTVSDPPLNSIYINDYAICPNNRVFVLSDYYLHTSHDDGQTWMRTQKMPFFTNFDDLYTSATGSLAYAFYNGLWHFGSPQGTPEKVLENPWFDYLQTDGVSEYIYTISAGRDQIVVSKNYGASWEKLCDLPLPFVEPGYYFAYYFIIRSDGKIFVPSWWQGVGAILYSPDWGNSWQTTILPDGPPQVYGIGKDGRLYIEQTNVGISRSVEKLTTTENPPSSSWKVMPNPFHTGFTIQIPALPTGSSPYRVWVKDITGRQVAEAHGVSTTTEVNIPGLASGVYILGMQDVEGRSMGTVRVVKQ